MAKINKCKWCGMRIEYEGSHQGYHNSCYQTKQLSVIPKRKT